MCKYLKLILLFHKKGEALGENLAKWWGSIESASDSDGSKAVEMWYSEINLYDFNSNEFQFSAGHFSQLVIFKFLKFLMLLHDLLSLKLKVWKGSKSLGIGMAKSGDGFVVVCNYFKAGNAMGEFDSNVSPSVEINKKRVINKNLRKLYLN